MNMSEKMRTILFGLVFLTLSMAAGCQQKGDQTNSIHVSAIEFSQVMADPGIVVLDVRTDNEYKRGHLKEAILLDMYQPDFQKKILALDKKKSYYVYCHSGSRSQSAVKIMRNNGFEKAFNIEGGIISLTRAGISLTR